MIVNMTLSVHKYHCNIKTFDTMFQVRKGIQIVEIIIFQ